MRRNLWSAAVLALAAIVLGAVVWADSPPAGLVIMLIGLAVAAGLAAATLRRRPHVPWASAAAELAAGRAVVLWKPTCPYCTRLRRALRDEPGLVWVNVWADRDANQEVRRHNNGDEYVPTVLLGERVLRNPTADQVRAALAR